MISNWLVQCVFQKNKKTTQSMRVSCDFMVLLCFSESVLLEVVIFFL